MNFTNGMYVNKKGAMYFNCLSECTLNIVLHSQWSDYALELHFEWLRRLHLVGFQDNYTNEFFDASIKFYENLLPSVHQTPSKVIVFADDMNFDPNNFDSKLEEPSITYVIAHFLKWRLIEK